MNNKNINAVSVSNGTDGFLVTLSGKWDTQAAIDMAKKKNPNYTVFKPIFDNVENNSCDWH